MKFIGKAETHFTPLSRIRPCHFHPEEVLESQRCFCFPFYPSNQPCTGCRSMYRSFPDLFWVKIDRPRVLFSPAWSRLSDIHNIHCILTFSVQSIAVLHFWISAASYCVSNRHSKHHTGWYCGASHAASECTHLTSGFLLDCNLGWTTSIPHHLKSQD